MGISPCNLSYLIRKASRKFAAALAEVIHDTTSALECIQASLNSLAWVVLDDEIALDFFLVGQGRVCAVTSTSCCIWINALGKAEWAIQRLNERESYVAI